MGERSPARVALVLPRDCRKWLSSVLEPTGRFEVVLSTDNSLELLSALPDLQPEIVILGMALQGLDGIETLRRIKEEHQAPRCLMLNQYRPLSDRVALAGADRCMTIPCTGRALLRTLEELTPVLIQ